MFDKNEEDDTFDLDLEMKKEDELQAQDGMASRVAQIPCSTRCPTR